MAKRPSKALLEKAVAAAQLYCGSTSLNVKDAQRFYRRMNSAIDRVAAAAGMDHSAAAEQITAEARRRGCITPRPGQHF